MFDKSVCFEQSSESVRRLKRLKVPKKCLSCKLDLTDAECVCKISLHNEIIVDNKSGVVSKFSKCVNKNDYLVAKRLDGTFMDEKMKTASSGVGANIERFAQKLNARCYVRSCIECFFMTLV